MKKRSLIAATLAALLLSCGGAVVSTDAGNWEPLFNGADLSGWENVGDANWKVEDGTIVVRREQGQTNKGWLVTEREFADFKLRLEFKTEHDKFNSGVLIRDPGHAKVGRPAFNGFEVQLLNHQDGKAVNPSGSIYDLARAYPHQIEPDAWTEIEIHCVGDRISTFIEGEKSAEAHTRRSFLGAIGLQMHGGSNAAEYSWRNIELIELPPGPTQNKMLAEEMEAAPGEFVDFLAGKTLEDDFDVYWSAGAEWTLRDGVLRGEGPDEIAWIFDKGDYGDYILSFDYRLSAGGNAGTCHRFRWPTGGDTTKGPAFIGFECQIADTGELNPTGSIYSLARAFETDAWHRPIHRPEHWNHYRIYVRGDHVVTYVNRHKGAEAYMDRETSGRIGFQVHHPAEWVEYRSVKLKVVE
jgi:3-keto-disaccharide hydrolase